MNVHLGNKATDPPDVAPPDPGLKPRPERQDTDASLLAERTKTDVELARNAALVEEDADEIVEVARERAEATLRTARERADHDMMTAGAPSRSRKEIEVARAKEDGTVAQERALADDRLAAERQEHQRALNALLRLEREATDAGLLVERARADQVISTRDDFLGMVSHDLRNMLGGIALSAATLAKHAPTSGDSGALTLKHTERIQRFTARMNRLLGDLLDVVSLEAGMLHVTMGPFDANLLTSDAAEAFQPTFAAQGITLAAKVEPGELIASGDQERVLQVLANLFSNALKFTERGGHVALSVARTGSQVCFSVIDTGVGIPAAHATAIFERFRQVGTRDRRGLGLGLYIAKSIVEAHGGNIWIESPEGGGSAFHFTVPAAS
jgi:signal transduction histidine kinase